MHQCLLHSRIDQGLWTARQHGHYSIASWAARVYTNKLKAALGEVQIFLLLSSQKSTAASTQDTMERRAPAVKNKAPAPIQITAEQLLREGEYEADLEGG